MMEAAQPNDTKRIGVVLVVSADRAITECAWGAARIRTNENSVFQCLNNSSPGFSFFLVATAAFSLCGLVCFAVPVAFFSFALLADELFGVHVPSGVFNLMQFVAVVCAIALSTLSSDSFTFFCSRPFKPTESAFFCDIWPGVIFFLASLYARCTHRMQTIRGITVLVERSFATASAAFAHRISNAPAPSAAESGEGATNRTGAKIFIESPDPTELYYEPVSVSTEGCGPCRLIADKYGRGWVGHEAECDQ